MKQIYTDIAHAWSLSGSLPAPLRAVPKEYDDTFQKGLGEMRKLKTKIKELFSNFLTKGSTLHSKGND